MLRLAGISLPKIRIEERLPFMPTESEQAKALIEEGF